MRRPTRDAVLSAWLPVFQTPDGAMLLHHLSTIHPDQVGAYLDRMPTDDDHDRVVVEAYEVVEEPEVINEANHVKISWLIVAFGEGCRNVLILQAVVRLEYVSVISPRNPCTSRGPA
jgi:hypothetical protein